MKLLLVIFFVGVAFLGMFWYLMREGASWGPESEYCQEITVADRDLEDREIGLSGRVEYLLRGCE